MPSATVDFTDAIGGINQMEYFVFRNEDKLIKLVVINTW